MLLWASHLIVLSWIFSSVRQTFLTEFSVASPAPPHSVAFVIKLLFQIGIEVNFSASYTYWGVKSCPPGKANWLQIVTRFGPALVALNPGHMIHFTHLPCPRPAYDGV